MHILLVSPFDGGSHHAWAAGLVKHSAHDFDVVSLPDSHWHWRLQGGAVELAERAIAITEQHGKPDVIFATSMLDLATFSALTRRCIAGVPLVLYMHENQLTYPVTEKGSRSHAAGITQWKAMLTADRVVFNSRFHKDSLFAALPDFLSTAPDHDHCRYIDRVRDKASVLHVGVDVSAQPPAETAKRAPLILWNQRWTYDKNPEAMLHSLVELDELGLDFRVAICGGHPNPRIPLFAEVRERLGEKVAHFGWAERAEYLALVQEADIVLSTARHEFFGIAVMEALRCGAMGILPNRLAYAELVEDQTSRQLYGNAQERMRLLSAAVRAGGFTTAERASAMSHYARYDWSSLAPKYDALLGDVTASHR